MIREGNLVKTFSLRLTNHSRLFVIERSDDRVKTDTIPYRETSTPIGQGVG